MADYDLIVRNARIVEGFYFLRAVARESYRAAIGMGGCLPVNRLADSEDACGRAIENPTLRIDLAFRHSDGAQYGIVELLRDSNVVRADENMRKHFDFLPCTVGGAADRASPGIAARQAALARRLIAGGDVSVLLTVRWRTHEQTKVLSELAHRHCVVWVIFLFIQKGNKGLVDVCERV